jgi:hypothetical protein
MFVDDTWQEDSIFTGKTDNTPGGIEHGYTWWQAGNDHDGTAITGTMPSTFPWQGGTSIPAERIPCRPGNRYWYYIRTAL